VPSRAWLRGGRRLIIDSLRRSSPQTSGRLWSSASLPRVWCRQRVIVAMPYQVYVAIPSPLWRWAPWCHAGGRDHWKGLYGGGLIDRFDRRRIRYWAKAPPVWHRWPCGGALRPASTPIWNVFALAGLGTAALDAGSVGASCHGSTSRRPKELPSALSLVARCSTRVRPHRSGGRRADHPRSSG